MKLSLKFYLKCLAILFSLSPISLFAAGALDHFEVILNQEEAMVGESLDITIKAVDRDGEVVTEYDGDILVFSESDAEADFPNVLSENSYQFTAADQWEVKFENAVSFKNEWTQDIYVYDLHDENILGVTEIEISKKEAEKNVEIEILSPENGVTVWTNSINLSWKTRKNHQIKIILNDEQEFTTTSNSEWVFEKEIDSLIDGENSFIAQILSSEEDVIGTSKPISVKINSKSPEFKSMKIDPSGEVPAETEISVEVYSSEGLSKVTVILDDVLTELEEWNGWVYWGKIFAPTKPWKYSIDVKLLDEFGHETHKPDAEVLFVTEKVELEAAPEEPQEEEIIIEEETPGKVTELDLDITGIKLTELKTKSILTWDALPEAQSYNIYKKVDDNKIQLVWNVTEPRYEIPITWDEIQHDYFAIKAVGKTQEWDLVQWDLSEMTKVQTGPELYILLAIIAMLITASGMFLMRKKA